MHVISLDPKTVLFMSTLTSVAMAIVMHSAHSNFGREVKGLDRWALGLLALTGAGFLFVWREHLPPGVPLMVANVLLLAGIGLSMIGVQEFYGQRPSWRMYYGITTVGAALIGWWVFIKPDFGMRVAVYSFLVLYFYAQQLLLVWRHGAPHFSTRFFGTLIGIQVVVVSLRGYLGLHAQIQHVDMLRDSIMANIYLALANFMVLMLTVAFMTMATRRLQTILEQRSTHDPLTGVLNRRGFAMFYEHQRALMRRAGKPVTLMAIDLDHFKAVNDRHGHTVGDQVLMHVAQSIRQALRDSDDVGRFGGEEFMVLLPDADECNAARVAERIRAALSAHSALQLPRCTISIGIGSHLSDDEPLDALLARADAALYRAKKNGRDRVELAERLAA